MLDKAHRKDGIFAVVMAGGEGARLRPLTQSIPKPLAPIAGEPVLAHMLRLLKRGGIEAAALTLMYKGEQIASKYGDSFEGMYIKPVFEEKPLGTAGSVKGTADFLSESNRDEFLVVSGDAVCDIDLRDVLKFHRDCKAEATIVLTRVKNPLEYGIVIGNFEGGGGKIEGFIEKPPYSLAYSDMVNTGIYVLSKSVLDSIPDGMPFDFARDLFYKMLSEGRSLFGYVFDGYWCDIGSPEAYHQCCMDAADGKIRGIQSSFSYDRSVVGSSCKIDEGSKIVKSVLQDNVSVGKNCYINEATICSDTDIEDGVTILKGCVVGSGCTIGKGAHIESGAKIDGGSVILPGTRVPCGLVDSYDALIYEEEIKVPNESYAKKIGAATAKTAKGKAVGFAHDGSAAAQEMYGSVLNGSLGENCDVYAFGRTHPRLSAFGAKKYGLEAAGYLHSDGDIVSLVLYDRNGHVQPHSFKRSLAKEMSAVQDKTVTDNSKLKNVSDELVSDYINQLVAAGGGRFGLSGMTLQLSADGAARIFARAAQSCGAQLCERDDRCDFSCEFDFSGQLVRISQTVDGGVFSLDRAHIRAVLLNLAAGEYEQFALACTEPAVYDMILKNKGCEVLRYSTVPADKGEDGTRAIAASVPWLCDDLFAAISLLSIAHTQGLNLMQLEKSVPEFYTADFMLDSTLGDPADFVRSLSRMSKLNRTGEAPTGGDGVVIEYKSGFARILVPSGNRVRVYCDAASAEAAEELAGFTKSDIEKYLNAYSN